MRVLFFGAGGRIGRALRAAAPAGFEVAAPPRERCDVRDTGQVRAAVAAARPDLVVNAVGHVAVDRAELEPEAARALNAIGAARIAAAAAEAGSRLVHLSSDYVFGGPRDRPWRPDSRPAPLSVYGRTKLEGERLVLEACPDALVVRTGWVYGSGGPDFLTRILAGLRDGDTLRVVDDQRGTPTWARSLADFLWRLVAADARGVHHLADEGEASWFEFAQAIAAEGARAGLLSGPRRIVPITSDEWDMAAERPCYSVLDKTETWALLGARAAHWRDNLRQCMHAMRAPPDRGDAGAAAIDPCGAPAS